MSKYLRKIQKKHCDFGHKRTPKNLTAAGGCIECKRLRECWRTRGVGLNTRYQVKPPCPSCGHRMALHDPRDGWRCYHATNKRYDCDCIQRPELTVKLEASSHA